MYKKTKCIIGSMMLVMMVILLGLPTPAVNAAAKTYYVAITGVDTNPGTSSFPFRNIQQCASVMVAGDTCLIQSGTYREIITPTNSGMSGLPITFRADTNATVVVSGTTKINDNDWTQYSGNIYMANFNGSLGAENQLFVNNGSTVTPLWEARWPNISEYTLPGLRNGMAIMQSGSSTSIVDTNLTQAIGFWNGATVWQRGGHGYLAQTTTVANFEASSYTLTLNAIPGNASYLEPSAGSTYYLSGVLGALDAANEWYVDSAAGKVYLWAPYGGVPTNVEVKQRVRAFELSNKSYIHITGIQTFAANIQMNNSNYNVLDGITAQHLYFSDLSQGYFPANQDDSGITIVGNNNEIKNSTIAYSTGTLIKIAGDNNRIVNNNIHDGDYMSSYAALIVLQSGNQNLISRNTVRDSGRTNIYWKKGSAVIEYNNIYNGMWISTDGGLLYTYGADLGNSVIHHNLIHDNKSELTGSLLYFDNFTENAVVHHNVIYNSGPNKIGIQLNTPGNFKLLYNNTVVNNGSSTSNWGPAPYSQESYGTRVFNNIFTNQLTLTADTVSDYNTTSSAGLNFVNAAANNYRLLSSSTATNAGAIIPGITNGYSSSAPDVGAYEYGGADWTAGHDFTNPPNPVYSTVNTAYMNLLKNSAFELGMVNWTKTGAMLATNVAVPTTPAWQYRGYISKLRLGTGIDGVTQTITGLQPNTGYKFVGWVYNDADEQVNIGVKDYGGSDTSVLSVDTQYVRKEINFTTGAANTSATVYITKTKTGTGYSYGDDFGLFETTAFNSGLNDSASLKDVLLTTPIITYTVGDSGNLTLTGTLRNGANAGLSSAVYTSSNPSVASIDSVTGTVATITARAGGQTTITGTVTIGGITKADTKVITVFPVQSGSSVADWTVRQYGANAKGFVEEKNGSYSLLGKGDNVWGAADDFVFLSKTVQPTSSNPKVTLTATINSNNSSNANATIGLMFRDKDTADSKHVHFRYEGTGALRYVYRNDATISKSGSGYLPIYDKYITYPVKLKLIKEGNTVTGYYQNKGAEWRIMGSVTCEFTSNNLLAGVGIFSGSGLTPVMADISEMEVVLGPPTPVPTPTQTPVPTPIPPGYGNQALNITPTASELIGGSSRVTDGVTTSNAFAFINTAGPQWIQIDLGQSYSIDKIKLWHYYADGRKYHDVIAQVSNVPDFSTKTTVFNNDSDNSAGQGLGSNAEYVESSSGKEITFNTTNARYVRLWTNGSTANVANHYVEVEVWGAPLPKPPGYGNQALNITPTASALIGGSSRATDGVTTSNNVDFAFINTAGPQWIQIDLGQSYNIDKIKLWHYYADGRKYHDVIAQVSNVPDFSTKTTVFNNDSDNSAGQGLGSNAEYVESSSGKEITFNTTNARYVRLWTNGSTANVANHYVEVEVWGAPVQPGYGNKALNIPPTTSTGNSINFPLRITNGVISTNDYASVTPVGGLKWIQLDLGQSYSLDKIKLWHYYADGRTYHDVIVQVSNDSNFLTKTTVFNNDTNNSALQGVGGNAEYAESSSGKEITFSTTNARYVRLWTNENSGNNQNNYAEVEVWGAPTPVTGVTLNHTSTSIKVNETATLVATVSPVNATNNAITWSSSNSGIATVDKNGVVSGIVPGTAVITVTTVDGAITASCTVLIVPFLEKVTLHADKIVLKSEGTALLSVTGTMSDGSPANLSNAIVKYSSDHAAVNVDGNGVVTVTGVGEGTVQIKVVVTLNGTTVEQVISILVDITPPTIAWEGIVDEQSYTDSVIPAVKAADALSGVLSLSVKLNGQDWTTGSAITQKGTNHLVASAVDNAGNIAVSKINFTLYESTSLKVDNSEGIYSDATPLRAVLVDAIGQPLAGETVIFELDGVATGTAVTDAQGVALLHYKLDVGASPVVATLDHSLQAVYVQNDAMYYRGSTASGILTVGKEEATITYTGTSVSPIGTAVTLSALVTQQADGSLGNISGLPVQFTLSLVNPNGTLSPYNLTVEQSMILTDGNGSVSVAIQLPAGLYRMNAKLMNNSYYKVTESTSDIAVYDATAGEVKADGWFTMDTTNEIMGSTVKKVHIKAQWEYNDKTLLPEGRLSIQAIPGGLKLKMKTAQWLVIAENSGYVQGQAQDDKGNLYTVRVMMGNNVAVGKAEQILSLILWNGDNAQGTPIFQALGQKFSGKIKFERDQQKTDANKSVEYEEIEKDLES